MVTHILNQLRGLALCVQADSAAPEWVQLTPAGPAVVGRDGRGWRLTNPAAVVAAYDAAKKPQIDIEHSSQLKAPRGEPAPAVGWIEALDVRDGAIWGRVEWTADGAAQVTGRAYRYLSPAFRFDPDSGEILQIVSAGLTNNPNLEMAALNAADKESDRMDKAVLEALGLKADANAADAVVAINALKVARDTALNSAAHPDPDKFVPKADHQLALNQLGELRTAEAARKDAEIVAAVDAAVEAGKIAPASKDYHLASCRADGGYVRFKTMIAAAPAILDKTKLPPKPGATTPALDADQLAVCQQLGLSPEDIAKVQE